MVQVPLQVFQKALDTALGRTIRPASKKYMGSGLRRGPALTIVKEVWEKLTAMESGFVPKMMEARGKSPALERTEHGVMRPTRTTSSFDHYKVRLQEPTEIASFCQMEKRCPGRGYGGAMLIKKKGFPGRRVTMAAGPLIVNYKMPMGKLAFERLPSLTYKMNVVMMDENADVTFGNKDYPSMVSDHAAFLLAHAHRAE